ncbi:hypothetical protein L1887_15442 [Cichorium endivia]|nr:hypothetical protein L1887_15442 [Cichorium endivia]
MGMSWEYVVLIEERKNSDKRTVVMVNCPDKAGFSYHLVRNVLEFGLYVTRGAITIFLQARSIDLAETKLFISFLSSSDFSTDRKWCYIVLWVVSRPRSLRVDWESLKK